MCFSFGHNKLCGFIDIVAGSRPVPVDDYAIDASADHVVDLPMHLRGIRRAVSDVHVVGAAEPQHEMGIYLGVGTRIKQRMHVSLADVSRTGVAVGLRQETVGRARVICGQSFQSGCGYDGCSRHAHSRCEQER